MIPLRVKLAGFLSYRDEAVLDFDGATLWMLRGPNGAGKSSVFDAISYALYGSHRGGVQGAESLIHHASPKLLVEFDFALGEDTFRVQRTLSRGSSGQRARPSFQVWHLSGPDAPRPGQPSPQAVPETSSAEGLKKWVRAAIGLSRETFCASVLLQQNRSDALLEADPAQRHEMLSQIVDLSAYRKVGDKADVLARESKALADSLTRRLSDIEPIDQAEIERLALAEASASTREDEAEARGRRFVALRVHSERWNALVVEQERVESFLQAAHVLLARRESIERDARRFDELKLGLPLVEDVLREARRAQELREDEARERRSSQVLGREAEELKRALEEAQAQADDLRARHKDASERLDAASEWLLSHSSALRDLQALSEAREAVQVLDAALAAYPDGLDAQAQDAQRLAESLASLKAALPHIEDWAAARSSFHTAREATGATEDTLQEIASQLDAARQRCKSAAHSVEGRAQSTSRAAQSVARAEMTLQAVDESIARFEDVEAQPSCRYCGQVLTVEHRQSEAARLQQEKLAAQDALDAVGRERDEAEQVLASARVEHKAADEELEALQERRRQHEQSARDASRDESDALARAARAWTHLDAAHRSRLLGEEAGGEFAPAMLNSLHPSAAQVLAWRDEAVGEAQARSQSKALLMRVAARERDMARREPIASRLASLEAAYPPAQEQALRLEETRATQERLEAARERSGLAEPLAQAQARCSDAQAARQNAEAALALAESRAANAAAQSNEASRTLERLLSTLPPQWRQAVAPQTEAPDEDESATLPTRCQERLARWQEEACSLQEAPTHLEELSEALRQIEKGQERLAGVKRGIEEAPPEARRALADLDAECASIEGQRREAARERDEAGDKKRRLQERSDERSRLEEQERVAGHKSRLGRHLADLLGRDGLQRSLLQEAEASIVEGANHVLDRLSGGHLRLELRALAGEDTDEAIAAEEGDSAPPRKDARTDSPLPKTKAEAKALDLVACNVEVAGQDESVAMLPVAFLSGSQKFRVSVALALGIGQFASAGSRRIESVIVDEGFGSLDKAGTREMIDELHALGNTLARVIVVSHQDDFANAFSNRYSIELHDGTSRASLQGQE